MLPKSLAIGESIELPGGRRLTQQELYLEAIKLNPENPESYVGVASTLAAGGSVLLPDGRNMTKPQLCLYAIKLDPNYSRAYLGLVPHQISLERLD